MTKCNKLVDGIFTMTGKLIELDPYCIERVHDDPLTKLQVSIVSVDFNECLK